MLCCLHTSNTRPHARCPNRTLFTSKSHLRPLCLRNPVVGSPKEKICKVFTIVPVRNRQCLLKSVCCHLHTYTFNFTYVHRNVHTTSVRHVHRILFFFAKKRFSDTSRTITQHSNEHQLEASGSFSYQGKSEPLDALSVERL